MFVLESERLILRPPRPLDIAAMTVWLGDFDVAKNLSRVPHPYGEADAEDFLVRIAGAQQAGADYGFSILRKEDGQFIGNCGLHPAQDFEFGYWLGKPFWGQGYASEAVRRLVGFAFEELGRDDVHAGWFHDNPASGHVLAKLGARHNGSHLRDCRARGAQVLCHDMLLTRADFQRRKAA